MIKKLLCKIFGHKFNYESEIVVDNGNFRTVNYKYTCKRCDHIEEGGYTSFKGPTITINK